MTGFKLKALALCMAMAATPVFAQSDEDKAALDAMLTKMSDAMKAGDMAVTMEMLPPTLLETMAEGSGLDKDQLVEATRAQAQAAGSAVTFTEVELGGEGIEWKKTDSGKDYALVPSMSVVEVKDPSSDAKMKMKQTATFVAFAEDGDWYMVDISNPEQQTMFTTAYPDFEGVSAPESTMEMVQ